MINTSPQKRGRPKSVAKRQDIMHAGAHLFLESGYSATSMDKVANRAGVSKQTLYSHFNSKNDLFRACISAKVEEYQLDLSVTANDKGVRENLFKLGCGLFDLYHDEGVICVHRLLMAESTNHPSLCELYYQAGPLATLKGLATYLQKSVPERIKNETEAFEAAEIFIGSIETAILRQTTLGIAGSDSKRDRDSYVNGRVNWFMRSLGPTQMNLI